MPVNKVHRVHEYAAALKYGLLALDSFYEGDPPDSFGDAEDELDMSLTHLQTAANYLIATYEEHGHDIPVVLQQLEGG